MNHQWVKLAVREIALSVGTLTPDEMASRIAVLAATKCWGDAIALAFVAEFWNEAERAFDDHAFANALMTLRNVELLSRACEQIKQEIGGNPPPVVTQLSERDVHDALAGKAPNRGRPTADDRGSRRVASADRAGGPAVPGDGAPPSIEGWPESPVPPV